MPGANTQSAAKRAEELRKRYSESCVSYEGKELKITASFGSVTYPKQGASKGETLIKDDKALWRSKRSESIFVTVWDEKRK